MINLAEVLSADELGLRKNVFVKVSGDELSNPKFQTWIRDKSSTSYVVVLAGGGTQITEMFTRLGLPLRDFHRVLGRPTPTFIERLMAYFVLARNKAKLEDQLAAMGIHVTVEIPVINSGAVLCHVNGDIYTRAVANSYDEVFVVTMPQRLEKKRLEFQDLEGRVEVIAFD